MNILQIVMIAYTIAMLAATVVTIVLSISDLRAARLRHQAAVAEWDREVKKLQSPDSSQPPFSTNYLLQEGFLTVVRKRDQQIVLHAEVEGILAHFQVGFDANTGVPRIHNEVTHEVTVVTSEFLDKWAENRS